jgi:ABC-type uncharacterized transport system involved in gliding motility auxiliary subunit
MSVSGILALGLIVLLVNSLSDSFLGRASVDLTEEGLFSLSQGTKNIVGEIKEPVTLKLYLSRTEGSRIPAIKMYGNRVRDLLKTYESQAAGKIQLEVYDPRPDSEEEEWAQKYGLAPIPLPSGNKLYFGLVAVNALGEEEVLPVFNLQRQEFLEYDISKIIYALNQEDKPLVGVISSLDVKPEIAAPTAKNLQEPLPDPWILVSQLEKFANVVKLDSEIKLIPENVDLLLVVHPKNLSEPTLYAIDQYVVAGGNAVIAVDPYASVDQPANADPRNPMASLGYDRSSNLNQVTGAWGVNLDGKKVVGDISLAASVSRGRNSPPLRFPVWLALGEKSGTEGDVINRESIITSDLDNLILPWAGALNVTETPEIKATVLLESTARSMLYSENDMRFSAESPDALLKNYVPGVESKVLAVQLIGKFKSSFESRPGEESDPVLEENVSREDQHLGQGVDTASVLIIADVDFMADRYSAVAQSILGTRLISLLNDNLIFAINAIENLTGSDNLISLRSRGKFSRPFTTVQQIEADAQTRYQEEETQLQAKLSAGNQRITQLQSGASAQNGKAVFTSALMDEIQKFRDERKVTQQKLRDVRRKLREDKERLGTRLFVLNTFLMPGLLIIGSLLYYFIRSEPKRERNTDDKK